MSYIQRAQEDLLKKLIKQGKILLLTGSRQVGKSTIIEHNFPDYNKVNLDDPYIVMQREEVSLFCQVHKIYLWWKMLSILLQDEF